MQPTALPPINDESNRAVHIMGMNPEPLASQDEKPLDPYEGGPLGAGIDWSDPNSRLAPLYFSTGGLTAVTLAALSFLLFSAVPLWHTDFWSHLKYGEWIYDHRALPEREPLNPFTDKQANLFDAQWLTQVIDRQLFHAGEWLGRKGDAAHRVASGVEVIRLVYSLAAVAVVGLLALAYRRAADSMPWAIGGMVFVLVFMLSILAVQRPQLLAIVSFAALLCGLSRPQLARRTVVWLPVLMVLWANLHGSFVVGFALLGMVLVGRFVEVIRETRWSMKALWHDTALRRLSATLVLAIAAVAFLNPYGPSIYLDVIRFATNINLKTMSEWQPLDFSQPRGGHWGYLAIVVLLVLVQLASPRPFSPTQILLVVTFGVWPLFQQRSMTWWIPLVPWIIAPHCVAIAERYGWHLPESLPSFRKTAMAVLVVFVIAFISPPSSWVRKGQPRPLAAALNRGTPRDVAAALTGQPLVDPNRFAELVRAINADYGGRFIGRVFCSEIQGEYLLWALPEDMPVMMFNHPPLFTPDYWNECLRVKEAAPDWWEILDRHRADVVVVEVDMHPELCALLRESSTWRVVVDEAETPARDKFARLLVAVRNRTPAAAKEKKP